MKPDTPESDNQQLLKRRARRRLFGAAFFVIIVAAVLPLLMDTNPPPQLNEFRIITADEKRAELQSPPPVPLPPEVVPASAMPAAPGTIRETADVEKQDPLNKSEVAKDVTEKPAVAAAPVPATAPGAVAASLAKDKKSEGQLKSEASPEIVADKSAELKKTADKSADKGADKPVQKSSEKATDKKPADKSVTKSADKSTDKKEAKDPAQSGQYYIQVGVFADADNVKQVRQKLTAQGVSSWTEAATGNLAGKTRVKAGPFASKEAADKAMARISKAGLNGMVVKK